MQMNYQKLRQGQREALSKLLDNIRNGKQLTSIVLPTRYGKSDVMRTAAYIGKEQKLIGGAFVLSPQTTLRGQIVDSRKVVDMCIRYGLQPHLAGPSCLRTMSDAFELRPFSNGEYLISATIQLATLNVGQMVDISQHIMHATGLPLLWQIDECHETSDVKRRGELVERLKNAGAYIALYTATAVRADGDRIPGFEVQELSREESIRHECCDSEDPDKVLIKKYAGDKVLVRLKADHETTFRQAWDERPSPLCNLSREVIDVQIEDGEGKTEAISKCSKSRASDLIGKAVRNSEVIRRGVSMMLAELRTRKRINQECAAMVFTSSDDGDIANAHANQVAEEIKRQMASSGDDFVTQIITMKSDDDEKAAAHLTKFCNGHYDIVIVKQMGGAGLDVGRLKVLLDLSSQRTVSSVIQRLMRVATPWQGIRTGTIITLADPLMDAIWKRYVVEEGGEHDPTGVVYEDELVETYLKDREESDNRIDTVTGAELSMFDDNNGAIAAAEIEPAVNGLLDDFPELVTTRTKAEIATILLRNKKIMELVIVQDKQVTPLDDEIERKQQAIKQKADDIIKRRVKPYTRDKYEAEARKLWNAAYRSAGVSGAKLHQIRNVETLKHIESFMDNEK
jgi:metal-responsive CopG/Arc/MetJ family transcriptional regulator